MSGLQQPVMTILQRTSLHDPVISGSYVWKCLKEMHQDAAINGCAPREFDAWHRHNDRAALEKFQRQLRTIKFGNYSFLLI
jgi:hypothetical protein